jgi:hypothetical protein
MDIEQDSCSEKLRQPYGENQPLRNIVDVNQVVRLSQMLPGDQNAGEDKKLQQGQEMGHWTRIAALQTALDFVKLNSVDVFFPQGIVPFAVGEDIHLIAASHQCLSIAEYAGIRFVFRIRQHANMLGPLMVETPTLPEGVFPNAASPYCDAQPAWQQLIQEVV